MANLTISSLNCQGLGDLQKRRDVFHFLRKKSHNIYCLQDTHFNEKLEKYVASEWGYQCVFASYQSNARGVAILFNNNFEFKINKVERDVNGNFIVISLKTMDREIILVSIYGPNRDNPKFYESLKERINNYDSQNLLLVGDWNLVLDPYLDYDNYSNINNPKAKETVENMIIELNLTDVWRENNPQTKRFTWRRTSPLKQSRLDFFLLSEDLMWNFEDADIVPGYRSDHSMVILKLKFGKDIKRNSFWKFNSTLLKDKQYVDEINTVIDDIITEYSTEKYDAATLNNTSLMEIDLTVSDKIFIDFLLMKLRSKTIAFATMRKKKATEKENNLVKEIEDLEKIQNLAEEDIKLLKEKNQELVTLRERKIQGVILRSRAKWVAEGEKINNYFCNLEKRHFTNKCMTKLIDKNEMLIDEPQKIKQEVNVFYKTLYTRKTLETCEITDLIEECPTLSSEEKNLLEGEISLEEAGLALKNMKNGKSPGTDGFGAEFYKFFWKKLGPFVVRALNKSFRDGELSATQREGLITCIPKPDKQREYIKNWRPISLLNVLYKIGAACIANRIKKILPNLICEDQTGFIANRYLGDNIRLIYDLISYLDTKHQPGLLLCLDFEKAFDSLDWKFMFKVLEAYGFGENICNWIKTFYKNIKSTVIVNGQTSDWFAIQRGCRQGDPLSPYLFVMCIEILAIMIRENKDIKGIMINNKEHKISQFADDAQLMNNGDNKSFEKSIELVIKFGNASGLYMNAEKTQAIWLGSKKSSKIKYMQHLNINWNPQLFKILGVWFTQDVKDCEKINYEEKLSEIKALFKIWMRRNITPLGRVAVLKSLILSKLIHLWMLLPDPPDDFINNLQKMCFLFIWNGKQDRISRKTTKRSVKNGGLNVPDIKKYIEASKLTWLRKFKSTNHKWKNISSELYPFLLEFEKYGPSYALQKVNGNMFWKHTFRAYNAFCKHLEPTSPTELLSEPILYNEKITIGNSVITLNRLINKGIYCIAHFLNDNGSFLTNEEFNRKYKMNINFLIFNGYKMSIKKYMQKTKIRIPSHCTNDVPVALKIIYSVPKGTRLYYDILTSDTSLPNSCSKWLEKLGTNVSWKKVFLKIHKIQEVKLKWLQIRIVHRILGTNVVLKEMGIVNNTYCDFCLETKDSIDHIFWKCRHSKTFWETIEEVLKEKCITCTNIKLTENLVLFGTDNSMYTDSVFDLIILLGKMYIYKCKYQKCLPNVNAFERYLTTQYKIEEHNAKLTWNLHIFKLKWIPYIQMVNNEC